MEKEEHKQGQTTINSKDAKQRTKEQEKADNIYCICCVSIVGLDKKIPIPQILSDLKYFSKRYDFYMEKPERALEQQEIFEHGYGITIYEHEQDTYGKNQEKEIEDDYNEIEP